MVFEWDEQKEHINIKKHQRNKNYFGKKGRCIMIVRKDIDFSKGLTPEQIKMLEALKDVTPKPDEDCPEFTKEELMQFKKLADQKREERRKQSVTLRLSPQALKKAKSLGKGYTSVLSRILESALSDNEIIEQYL